MNRLLRASTLRRYSGFTAIGGQINTGPVRSINGKTGMVTLTGEDIARSSSNPETVSDALSTQGTSIQTVRTQIGVTPLPTTAQTLTGAIAENAQEIADVEDNVIGSTVLPTTAQTLTGAIAENAGNIVGNANSITSIDNKIGTTALPTTAQTLTGAIAEHESDITTLNNNITTYNTINLLPKIADTYTGIDISDSRIVAVQISTILYLIVFHFKASGAISSGSVDLSTLLPATITEVYTSLASISGVTGFAQLSTNYLYIRTSGGDSNYICGQMLFRKA